MNHRAAPTLSQRTGFILWLKVVSILHPEWEERIGKFDVKGKHLYLEALSTLEKSLKDARTVDPAAPIFTEIESKREFLLNTLGLTLRR